MFQKRCSLLTAVVAAVGDTQVVTLGMLSLQQQLSDILHRSGRSQSHRARLCKSHLVTNIVTCRINLVELWAPLLINTNKDWYDCQRPHVSMLHK